MLHLAMPPRGTDGPSLAAAGIGYSTIALHHHAASCLRHKHSKCLPSYWRSLGNSYHPANAERTDTIACSRGGAGRAPRSEVSKVRDRSGPRSAGSTRCETKLESQRRNKSMTLASAISAARQILAMRFRMFADSQGANRANIALEVTIYSCRSSRVRNSKRTLSARAKSPALMASMK